METEGKLTPIELGEEKWGEIIAAAKSLKAVPDKDFKMSIERDVDKPQDFEKQTELVALGWRLIGSGQIPTGIDVSEVTSSFEGKSRLKFYVTFKALSDTFETEGEKNDVFIFNEVTSDWRETLTEEMVTEATNIGKLDEEERLGRLAIFADLSTRWLENVNFMPIDKLGEDGKEVVGESYLTMEEIERIGKVLLEKTGAERLFSSKAEKPLWERIGHSFEKLWKRRQENEGLVEDFFKKLQ
jgi:hypothetical protein